MKSILLLFTILQAGFCLAQGPEKLTVYFDFNKYSLDPVFKHKIDSFIQKNDIASVSITAHCDSIGSDHYNEELSQKRGNVVREYLISKGVDAPALVIKAMGENDPVRNNSSESERALNRRVEIVCVKKKAGKEVRPETPVQSVPKKDATAFNLDSIEVGGTFVIKNLNFYGGKHMLLPKSIEPLTLLLKTLRQYPTLEIEIQGHVCCVREGDGLDQVTGTLNLSVNRAKAIYEYLIKYGIEKSRLAYKGFGSSHKLVEEKTPEDQAINRRVEIKIVKK